MIEKIRSEFVVGVNFCKSGRSKKYKDPSLKNYSLRKRGKRLVGYSYDRRKKMVNLSFGGSLEERTTKFTHVKNQV